MVKDLDLVLIFIVLIVLVIALFLAIILVKYFEHRGFMSEQIIKQKKLDLKILNVKKKENES